MISVAHLNPSWVWAVESPRRHIRLGTAVAVSKDANTVKTTVAKRKVLILPGTNGY